MARLAGGLGMKVVGVRAHPGPVPGVERVYGPDQLHEALSRGDFVVVATPLTDRTHHMSDRAAITAMKPGVGIVDVSRGGVIHAAALIEALGSGHVGGAVLDVHEEEPLPRHSPLWTLENAIVTPHCSGAFVGWERASAAMVLRQCRASSGGVSRSSGWWTRRPDTEPGKRRRAAPAKGASSGSEPTCPELLQTIPLGAEAAFPKGEFDGRVSRLQEVLAERGLDLYITTGPENIFYLTGQQSPGYSNFQSACVPRSGTPFLVSRGTESFNARLNSFVEDIYSYGDGDDPGTFFAGVLEERGLAGKRIAVDLDAWYLSVNLYRKLRSACGELHDGSGLVERFRRVKSPLEIESMELAGKGCRRRHAGGSSRAFAPEPPTTTSRPPS